MIIHKTYCTHLSKGRTWDIPWTHKRHLITHHIRWAMGCVSIMISVAYRYRKSISIIELFVSIISIYIGFLATNFYRSLSKFTGWAIIQELSKRRRVRRFLNSWGQRAHVKPYNIDLSSWYEFWFALICIDMNAISALSTAIQQFRDGFDSK